VNRQWQPRRKRLGLEGKLLSAGTPTFRHYRRNDDGSSS